MKLFNTMQNVGKVKYLVNFHDGIKAHKDGSMFFDIRTFKNKKEFENFQTELKNDGYFHGDSSFKITKDNIHLYYEFMSDEDLELHKIMIACVLGDRDREIFKQLFSPSSSNQDEKFTIFCGHSSDKRSLNSTYKIQQTVFGVKDTLKPIDEYIAEIKASEAYKAYIGTTLSKEDSKAYRTGEMPNSPNYKKRCAVERLRS